MSTPEGKGPLPIEDLSVQEKFSIVGDFIKNEVSSERITSLFTRLLEKRNPRTESAVLF